MQIHKARIIENKMFVGKITLHTKKYATIPIAAKTNLFSNIIKFILQRTITQIISEIAYPNKVANDAPSIPKTGIIKQFIAILAIAPAESINILGQVFFTTRNWLAAT